jgi:hypothetical protein
VAVQLELTGQRRVRGEIIGTVRVIDGGSLVFADAVNLSRGKSRREFVAAVGDRLNGNRPERVDFEAELLGLLLLAEAQLANEATPTAPRSPKTSPSTTVLSGRASSSSPARWTAGPCRRCGCRPMSS